MKKILLVLVCFILVNGYAATSKSQTDEAYCKCLRDNIAAWIETDYYELAMKEKDALYDSLSAKIKDCKVPLSNNPCPEIADEWSSIKSFIDSKKGVGK